MEEGVDEVYGGLVDKINFIAMDEIFFHNSGQNLFQICLEYVSVVPRKGSISEVCASLCLRNLILSYEGKSFKKCGLDLDWNSGFCRNCPISLSQNDFFQSSSSFENLSLSR